MAADSPKIMYMYPLKGRYFGLSKEGNNVIIKQMAHVIVIIDKKIFLTKKLF